MSCKYATQTEKKWFDDLSTSHRVRFACQCTITECRCPERLPPSVMKMDVAGIHSRIRMNEDGTKKSDFILVRSKFCNEKNCQDFKVKE